MADLRAKAEGMPQPLRVASVFPRLTAQFLDKHGVRHEIVEAEGSLEVMPEIGSADCIADLVETGSTLLQNRLRMIAEGVILNTQSVLAANRASLQRPEVMRIAEMLLEHFEAHLRAQGYVMLVANVRGQTFEDVGRLVTERTSLGGLQGPTVAPIFPNPHSAAHNPNTRWFSVTLVVRRAELTEAIAQLRGIGGSGVIVTPVTYIFEEQPARVAMLRG
jgi:ATP phosphoribosyltransferase